ncbi:hypothetical protein EON67_05940 [archaeon]|nr:MAG: hypothetical protein EON67_05940 [archaeon]
MIVSGLHRAHVQVKAKSLGEASTAYTEAARAYIKVGDVTSTCASHHAREPTRLPPLLPSLLSLP